MSVIRLLDFQASTPERVIYAPCRLCQEDRKEQGERDRLEQAGAQSDLLHATFSNWLPRDEVERQHLAAMQDFATKTRRGFAILLGGVGLGKTHLSVAAMREFSNPRFYTQDGFLRALRMTYRDEAAPDPVELSEQADLVVLDDVGVSPGGKDEWPALSRLLTFRYIKGLPTVLTSNLGGDALRDLLGERLADRLAEKTFKVMTFSGPSHRPQLRAQFFAEKSAQTT